MRTLFDTSELDTICDFIRFGLSQANATNLYYGHGTDNAQDDIVSLILESLYLPFDYDATYLQARLTHQEKKILTQNLQKRIVDRIPVPYITKKAYFCGLEFYIDERALIPRSPIAELIQQSFSPWIDLSRVNKIMDLCTGSACIAIACQYAFPDAEVDAVDLSKDALEVAQINLEKHRLSDEITLYQSDCFDDVPKQKYNIIVSNPPYVGAQEMQTLPQEYLHEPKFALETENNGLKIVEKIMRQADAYLEDDGILVVEVGNSDEALAHAFPDIPFTWLEFEAGGHGVFVLTKSQLQAL